MNQQAMMKLRKMQKQMEEAQKRLEETTYTGTAGGGMVKATVKGDHTVLDITIDPEAFESKDDIEMIQDTVVAALNDAFKKLEADANETMGAFTGGLGGFGGLF
ncbi:MAG: YbaB/EbfC family nucleoid-associated protein [Anaeroplasmataceae bacterium]